MRLVTACVKRPLHMSEQLAFHERVGNGGDVDDHKGPARSRTVFVNRFGNQLFAGAGLAEYEHGAIRASRAGRLFADLVHGLRSADDLVEASAWRRPARAAFHVGPTGYSPATTIARDRPAW